MQAIHYGWANDCTKVVYHTGKCNPICSIWVYSPSRLFVTKASKGPRNMWDWFFSMHSPSNPASPCWGICLIAQTLRDWKHGSGPLLFLVLWNLVHYMGIRPLFQTEPVTSGSNPLQVMNTFNMQVKQCVSLSSIYHNNPKHSNRWGTSTFILSLQKK